MYLYSSMFLPLRFTSTVPLHLGNCWGEVCRRMLCWGFHLPSIRFNWITQLCKGADEAEHLADVRVRARDDEGDADEVVGLSALLVGALVGESA